MGDTPPSDRKLRLLVAIASYGEKNLPFLRQIIQRYQGMAFEVSIVVVSEAPKNLGPGVQVVVGLPSKDPWSLPFAHKAVFAREVEHHDLFLYSEDDIQFSQQNIEAFLRATPQLAPDEIAGFLLYEKDPEGVVWLPSVYQHFHWKPDSVRRRGSFTVAEFSNEHSASYLLTQAQLKRAIASGGFLREPYEGRYDMLCTASTDPYTSCGFRKVICISDVEDFLVHHTPDKYTDISFVSLPMLKDQLQALMEIQEGRRSASALCAVEPEFRRRWQKSFYEKPCEELLSLVPPDAKTVLSIGCGWGATEARLQERGAKVTALPLDPVIGAMAARRGIDLVYGTWEECLAKLNGRRFDCVMLTNLLHLQPSAGRAIEQWAPFVAQGGTFLVGGPNFDRAPWLIKRRLGIGQFGTLRSYGASKISLCGPATLPKHLKKAGLNVAAVRWINHDFKRSWLAGKDIALGWLTAKDWILQAARTAQG